MKNFFFILIFILIFSTTALGKERKGDYSVIYQRNIFGASTAKKETILKPIEIPLAEKLLLKGIIIRKEGLSLAVIENRETKAENLYKVGDILLGGEIVLIEEKSVVIKNKENKEITLFFAYHQGAAAAKRLVLSPFSGEIKVLKMKGMFKKLKTKLSLLSRIRVKPTLVSGKVNGYQVTNVPSDPFFEAIGIKNGDAVRKVNGNVISSIPQAYEIYRNLKPNSVVKVDIVRDGKPVTLKYRLE